MEFPPHTIRIQESLTEADVEKEREGEKSNESTEKHFRSGTSHRGSEKYSGNREKREQHLKNIGIHRIEDLNGKDPEELYGQDCLKKGFQEDRCALYVYRCAVYYAEHEQHEEEKLNWWYWKEKEYPEK